MLCYYMLYVNCKDFIAIMRWGKRSAAFS